MQAAGKNFEVIFASSDRDESQFNEYFAEMPWLAIPYADRKRKEQLSSRFGVSGIPMLVILDENREVITTKAVGAIRSDETKSGVGFPWAPEVCREVDNDAEGIDESPSFIILQEKLEKAAQEANKAMLKPLIEKINEAAKVSGDDAEFNFFFASKEGGLAGRVRSECGQGDAGDKLQVVMMDIPDQGGYYKFEKELSVQAVEEFMADYKAKKLTRCQMGSD